ncbi:MAG: 23S rRNA (guanosine(2251)-2'-O)-methyltransferase RlmB [Clostridiales bacterium]|nr:23S rRNA (guanosine(2251)-2'-O)-methyltransferase RlmB [Clostridiales bacterium]MDD7035094.1 23S rRNA (guanosine(2251)-2'-O)-methyltransferase RlmB [Bacillota bacterium]MDY2920419.1 23S rRNA (guanosine(2251)-2'-O)-methyltransferase RlmB [Lentihominibacter sp.]
MSELIMGRNAVLEALKAGREIEKINIEKNRNRGGSLKQIIAKASDAGIPVYYSDRAYMDKLADGSGASDVNDQGVIALASDFEYSSPEDILELAEKRGEDPFILVLDGIEDPHNLGAIIRTAECAGVHGVIIPKRRSASVNETVLRTSAGAAEYMLCARVTNIGRTIEMLQDKGVWVCACDMGEELMYQRDLTGPLALVIGSEGFGISRLVKEKCDFVATVPMKGHVNSLNASNAAAIVMYEALRQRL